MSDIDTTHGIDRLLRRWLRDGPEELSDRALADTLAQVHVTPQVRRWLRSRRPGMTLHPTTLVKPIAVAATIATLAIGGTFALFRPFGAASPGASASAAPTLTPPTSAEASASSSTPWPSAVAGTGVYVTSRERSPEHGVDCGTTFCDYNASLVTTDSRLEGCYELITSGYARTATWGTALIRSGDAVCVAGYQRGAITWEGVWFTGRRIPTDPRTAGSELLNGAYPIDTIWLSGRGANEGLVALLRLDDPTTVEGWLLSASGGH